MLKYIKIWAWAAPLWEYFTASRRWKVNNKEMPWNERLTSLVFFLSAAQESKSLWQPRPRAARAWRRRLRTATSPSRRWVARSTRSSGFCSSPPGTRTPGPTRYVPLVCPLLLGCTCKPTQTITRSSHTKPLYKRWERGIILTQLLLFFPHEVSGTFRLLGALVIGKTWNFWVNN